MIEPGRIYQDQWGKEWKIVRGYSPSATTPEPLFLAVRTNGSVQIIVGSDGLHRGSKQRSPIQLRDVPALED